MQVLEHGEKHNSNIMTWLIKSLVKGIPSVTVRQFYNFL